MNEAITTEATTRYDGGCSRDRFVFLSELLLDPTVPTPLSKFFVVVRAAKWCCLFCLLTQSVMADGTAFEQVQLGGKHQTAQEASAQLVEQFRANRDFAVLRPVLETMEAMTPTQRNWASLTVTSALNEGRDDASIVDSSMVREATRYVDDQESDPIGRSTILQWLRRVTPDAYQTRLDDAADDPSLPIRQLAIAKQLANQELSNDQLSRLLPLARHPKHIETIVDRLKKGDVNLSLAEAFKMVPQFAVLGPLDNRDGIGFDMSTSIEADIAAAKNDVNAIALTAVPGKGGDIQWSVVKANDQSGFLDLADHLNKEKGAFAYAMFVVRTEESRAIELRLQSINANKVWFNGKEVLSNEIYHAGTMLDQYIAKVTTLPGNNVVLIKSLQNEQTQAWAQDWQFRIRMTDLDGTPLDLMTTTPDLEKGGKS